MRTLPAHARASRCLLMAMVLNYAVTSLLAWAKHAIAERKLTQSAAAADSCTATALPSRSCLIGGHASSPANGDRHGSTDLDWNPFLRLA